MPTTPGSLDLLPEELRGRLRIWLLARVLVPLPRMSDWKAARRGDPSLLSEWQVYRMIDIESGPWAAFQFLVRERLREEGVAVAPDGRLA